MGTTHPALFDDIKLHSMFIHGPAQKKGYHSPYHIPQVDDKYQDLRDRIYVNPSIHHSMTNLMRVSR